MLICLLHEFGTITSQIHQSLAAPIPVPQPRGQISKINCRSGECPAQLNPPKSKSIHCLATIATGPLRAEGLMRSGRTRCKTCLKNHSRLFLGWFEMMPGDLPPEAQIKEMTTAVEELDKEVRSMAENSNN